MKKLFAVALSTLALLGVTACGGNPGGGGGGGGGGQGGYDETVRVAANGDSVNAQGNYMIKNAEGEWERNDWTGRDGNKMTAVSVKTVSTWDTAVADKLQQKAAANQLDWIYAIDVKTELGAGWNDLIVHKADGTWTDEADGTFAFKAREFSYDAELEVYTQVQWIPNPNDGHAAHVEPLTDNVYMPPYIEEPQPPMGASWANNPALNTLEDGAVFHFVVAKYKAQSDESTIGYGMALIKVNA